MVEGESKAYFKDPSEAIEASYAAQVFDEQFEPVVITDGSKPIGLIKDGDAVISFNFRADRMREITKAFVLPGFDKFPRTYMQNLFYVSMTEYEKDLPLQVAFVPEVVESPVAKVISDAGLAQLHIAETEKFIETVLAGSAEFDNAVRRQRCVDGMASKINQGIFPWKPPIGYICG
jgi:bisphosphoglycerate-independent phosphoglycerate mutase (AlkP superfamily)